MPKPARRIVTGHDDSGRSVVLSDGMPPNVRDKGTDVDFIEIWNTSAARAAPLPELLEEFMQRRFERCRFIVESSLQLGEWEQTPVATADPVGLTARMLETVAASVPAPRLSRRSADPFPCAGWRGTPTPMRN